MSYYNNGRQMHFHIMKVSGKRILEKADFFFFIPFVYWTSTDGGAGVPNQVASELCRHQCGLTA